ncbi:neural Wiskott-Aldrich syndrome protein-like [Mauremys reevesii]|uniref:neural Wiskott-Aldrich syndrome protein-like n=1 Tax=Mauremys reevesii TaxID=260615 RepID=UPI00193FBAE3|nr:neural Wiskott-Aldrich syndrome protein-like [Mauremys reevesii]
METGMLIHGPAPPPTSFWPPFSRLPSGPAQPPSPSHSAPFSPQAVPNSAPFSPPPAWPVSPPVSCFRSKPFPPSYPRVSRSTLRAPCGRCAHGVPWLRSEREGQVLGYSVIQANAQPRWLCCYMEKEGRQQVGGTFRVAVVEDIKSGS